MSDKKYILLRSGLSNRLRTIVGFTYCYPDTVIFHWDTEDPQCNGKFNDLFKPSTKLTAIIDTPRQPNIKYFFEGQSVISEIIRNHGQHLVPKELKGKSLWFTPFVQCIEQEWYQEFRPHAHIIEKVNNFLKSNKLKPGSFASMHVRTTDHTLLAQKNNAHTTISIFDDFVKSHSTIYLATDAQNVQNRYKSHCIMYTVITQSDELRQTSLEDALIDILIASKAGEFIGSGYSSYSELIRIHKRIREGKK